MKIPRISFWVYLGGVALLGVVLGVWEGQLRSNFGDWTAFAAVIAYLLLLRVVAERMQRKRRA